MGAYERKAKRLHEAAARNDIGGMEETQKSTESFWDSSFISAVKIDEPNSSGRTALLNAAKAGSRDALLYLLSKGANPNHKDSSGRNAISYAAEGGFREIIADMLDKGCDVNEPDNKGITPLMYAAKNKHGSLVKYLVANNAKVNEQCHEGKTALMLAAKEGDCVSTDELLAAKADIDMRDNDGWSALMHAAYAEKIGPVEILIKHNARTDFRSNKSGKKAYELTVTSGIQAIIKKAENNPTAVSTGDQKESFLNEILPAANDSGPSTNTPLREKLITAMEREGLDSSQSEHWLPIGDIAIEHVTASPDSPRMLTNSFNFAAKQYVTTSRNLLTGENLSVVEGSLEKFPNQALVDTAYDKLKSLGKTPPPRPAKLKVTEL